MPVRVRPSACSQVPLPIPQCCLFPSPTSQRGANPVCHGIRQFWLTPAHEYLVHFVHASIGKGGQHCQAADSTDGPGRTLQPQGTTGQNCQTAEHQRVHQLVANSHLRQIIARNAGDHENAGGVKGGQGPPEDKTAAPTVFGLVHDLSGRAGGTCGTGDEGWRHGAVLEDETTIEPHVFLDNVRPRENPRPFGPGQAHGALQAW